MTKRRLLGVIGIGALTIACLSVSATAGQHRDPLIADTLSGDMVLSVYDAKNQDDVFTIDYTLDELGNAGPIRTIRLSDNFTRFELLDQQGHALIGYRFADYDNRAEAALLLSGVALQVTRGSSEVTCELIAGRSDETVTFESMAAFDRAVDLFVELRGNDAQSVEMLSADRELLRKAEQMNRWAPYFMQLIELSDLTVGPQLAQSRNFSNWLAKEENPETAAKLESVGNGFCSWIDVSRNLCALFEKDEGTVCILIRASQMVCEEFVTAER